MDVSNNLLGFYRAKVVNNKDPKKCGRVVVWVPQIMPDVEDNCGLWARPANNPVGGRNLSGNSEHYYMGTSYIPKIGSWVFVFFESGNPDNPYYFGSCDLENAPVLPENQLGSNYEDKWTIFKSHEGRTIIVSDDPDDERVEITGKKRLLDNPPSGNTKSVYKIDTNQTVILLDERTGLEKVLIRTRKGDYIHVDINERNLQCYFENDIRIECGRELSIKAGTNIRMEAGVSFLQEAHTQHSTLCPLITRDGLILDNSGSSVPAVPVKPEGERQNELTGDDLISAERKDSQEKSYNKTMATAVASSKASIDKYKNDLKKDPKTAPPPEYVLACELGGTSKAHESGNLGPSAVSLGKGDKGGVSYGSHQLKSEGGFKSPAGKFVNQSSYASDFEGLKPGSDEFSAKWKEVCARDPDAFDQEQYDFIKSDYYETGMAKVSGLGVDTSKVCFGVRELVWSTSVQFGSEGCKRIFERAGVTSADSDEEIIDKVYKEKGQVNRYFESSSQGTRESVANRFTTERLQNHDSCKGEECDKVPDSILNASEDDLDKVRSGGNPDLGTDATKGYEDFDNGDDDE